MRRTCWKRGRTCAPSRCYSVMLRWITPPSICTSPGGISMWCPTRSMHLPSPRLLPVVETGGSGSDEQAHPGGGRHRSRSGQQILGKAPVTLCMGASQGARCQWPLRWAKFPSPATTWQIFRKIEYAAGMPRDILSAAKEQASNRTRRRCNGFLLNVPCSHLLSVAWRMEVRTDLSAAR
jgi:hypothetical protein